jgi:hypothetical protein
MRKLQNIWDSLSAAGYKTDKGDLHSYVEVYEEILAPYRETAKNILEIGLFNGHSLRLWEEYFINADIYGIDCDEQPHGGMADLQPMIAEGYKIVIGDAASPFDISKHFLGMKFDVVVEDANHNIEQQLEIYNNLKPYMNKGSIYIIEDIQDIDRHKWLFLSLSGVTVEIIDRREIKQRYDDVLVIIKDKP